MSFECHFVVFCLYNDFHIFIKLNKRPFKGCQTPCTCRFLAFCPNGKWKVQFHPYSSGSVRVIFLYAIDDRINSQNRFLVLRDVFDGRSHFE